ncbi:MAG: hypothetical protein AAFP19_01680 [Bacteroidota bacterium]
MNMQKAPTPVRSKSLTRRVLRWLSLIVFFGGVLLAIALIAINNYLRSNTKSLLDQMGLLDNGFIEFEEATIRLLDDFPLVSVRLEKVHSLDSIQGPERPHLLQLDVLTASVSLRSLLKRKVALESVRLIGGYIDLYTDTGGYSNWKDWLQKARSLDTDPRASNLKLITNFLELQLSNVEIHFKDSPIRRRIQGMANRVNAQLAMTDGGLDAQVDMDLKVYELTFREERGTFLPRSRLRGRWHAYTKDRDVIIEPCDLQVNEEDFVFSARFRPQKEKWEEWSVLTFESKATRWKAVQPLLSQLVRDHLSPFYVEQPFYTKILIRSPLRVNSVPIVEVSFRLEDNRVEARDIALANISLHGQFINRLFDDERRLTEGRRRIRLKLYDLKTQYQSFNISTDSIRAQYTDEMGPQIQTKLEANGPAKGIGEWLENDQFFFERGQFELKAELKGSLLKLDELLINSYGQLGIKHFSVFYQPAKVAFPFEQLTLDKKAGDAFFTLKNKPRSKESPIYIKGDLRNIHALVLEDIAVRPKSGVKVSSKKITWESLVELFGDAASRKEKRQKSQKEKKRSMKETLYGLQANFQPRLQIALDTLVYQKGIQAANFYSDVYFEGQHTLIVDQTHFDYGNGKVELKARLDISDPYVTPFEVELEAKQMDLNDLLASFDFFDIKLLRAIKEHPRDADIQIKYQGILDDEAGLIPFTSKAEMEVIGRRPTKSKAKILYASDKEKNQQRISIRLSGDPKKFNDFFKNEQFFFDRGVFEVYFDYDGEISSFEELLTKATTNFSLENSEVFYKKADVTLPLKSIAMLAHEDHADFKVNVHSEALKRPILFSGKLDHLNALLFGDSTKEVSTEINIYGQQLIWQEFLTLFGDRDKKVERNNNIDAMKATIIGMINTFNPNIEVQIDRFLYSDKLAVDNFKTGVYLKNAHTLVLDKTGFNFQKGHMNLDGEVELFENQDTPFRFNLQTREFNLGGLLEGLDYLSIPVLEDMKKLNGWITMNLDLAGIIAANGNRLIPDATKGQLGFNLRDVEIVGLSPLDSIAEKLYMKKRFKEVRFAPLTDTLFIEGQNIEIPQMEIQSNALHLFLEGNYSFDEQTNLWISVPLKNLKITDRSKIPDKIGYARAKDKVYLEAAPDKNGKIRFKFHLTKRQFYKDRGILDQYKSDRRRDRKIRKEMKKRAGS